MRRRLSIVSLTILLSFTLFAIVVLAGSEPTADAYVKADTNATTNSTVLTVSGSNPTGGGCTVATAFWSYLKFDLSSINYEVGPSSTVTGNVSFLSSATGDLTLYSVEDDSWTEGAIDTAVHIPVTALDSVPVPGAVPTIVTFTGQLLADFLNQERPGTGGDSVASFVILNENCTNVSSVIVLNSSEATDPSVRPMITVLDPSAIELTRAEASGADAGTASPLLWVGIIAVVITISAGALIIMRRNQVTIQ